MKENIADQIIILANEYKFGQIKGEELKQGINFNLDKLAQSGTVDGYKENAGSIKEWEEKELMDLAYRYAEDDWNKKYAYLQGLKDMLMLCDGRLKE